MTNQVQTTNAVQATLHHRRSVSKLTAAQLDDLRRAFKAAIGERLMPGPNPIDSVRR